MFALSATPSVASSVQTILTTVTTVLTTITGNEIFMVFMSAGVLGIAIGTVKKLVGRY